MHTVMHATSYSMTTVEKVQYSLPKQPF